MTISRKEDTPWLNVLGPCRERCRACWKTSRVGFLVPDSVWESIVPRDLQGKVVCLTCFTEMGDERGVDWSRRIEFYPLSRVEAMEFLKGVDDE